MTVVRRQCLQEKFLITLSVGCGVMKADSNVGVNRAVRFADTPSSTYSGGTNGTDEGETEISLLEKENVKLKTNIRELVDEVLFTESQVSCNCVFTYMCVNSSLCSLLFVTKQ
jgi:hypothetical protein